MTTKILKSAGIVLIMLALFSFDLPDSWIKKGNDPESYDMGIEKGAGQNGKNAATIKSIKRTKGFGTLMQTCIAEQYLGKRLKMTGYVKSLDVKGWAGLWLRVDQKDSKTALGFDNMMDRPIKKTSDWKKYEIVLDVPANASDIAYGALLVGQGQIWFSDIVFEIVDNSTVVSDECEVCSKVLKAPTNLNFEK